MLESLQAAEYLAKCMTWFDCFGHTSRFKATETVLHHLIQQCSAWLQHGDFKNAAEKEAFTGILVTAEKTYTTYFAKYRQSLEKPRR